MLVEAVQYLYAFSFSDNSVVDRVVSNQLQVFERPIEADSSCEVIHSGVFVSELSWIVRADGDRIAEAEENGPWRHADVRHSSRQQIGDGIQLEANVLALVEILDPLEDVEAVTDADSA